jgi:F0F1-type ATP synthase membrane subunit b/b'
VSDSDQTLRQLLEVEKEAASVVEDARTKADMMTAEADREVRRSYNDRYQDAVAALDEKQEAALAKLKADCDDELARYQKELDAQVLNRDAFNRMARAFFSSPAPLPSPES